MLGNVSFFKLPILVFIFSSSVACKKPSNETTNNKQKSSFEWVFGKLADFDQDMEKKVLSGEPDKRYYVDKDGDGKPEEVWFIDVSQSHDKKRQPVMVRAIDEDGDLSMGGEPDLDSDLYLADWNADGTIDAAVDYEDLDGDQDVDRMGIYFYDNTRDLLRVWWSRDDGDDNLLWSDVDYAYEQDLCQNSSHFGGDESFVSFYIKRGEDHWTSFYEAPFLFFDCDRDGVSEEAIRVLSQGSTVHSIRWSFDADHDGTKENPRDYDVSISAYAQGWTLQDQEKSNFGLQYGGAQAEKLIIRGLPAGPVLSRSQARSFLLVQQWARVLMTWDENDLNVTTNPSRDNVMERWEGVIAAPVTEKGYEMPAVGGPDCGPYNKRYEIVIHPNGPDEYYYTQSDHRIHLKGSDKTWLKVDYNYDGQKDMSYEWTDADKDGIMDHLAVDLDGDGGMDDQWELDTSCIRDVKWTFGDLNSAYGPVISDNPELLFLLNTNLNLALESIRKGSGIDSVWQFIEQKMNCHLPGKLSLGLLNSDESLIYYMSLSSDRRIAKLKKLYPNRAFWEKFNQARSHGDIKQMTDVLRNTFARRGKDSDYQKWITHLRATPKENLVAWDNTWLPPNWGWESEKAAFRCYDGHFDLFGKRKDTLIYPTISSGNTYHLDDNGWGMDILHVGKTGGCGGVVLYIDGVAYPLRNEHNPGDPVYTARLFKETSDTVTIEFKVTGVGPQENPYTVYIRPSAIAGRSDSPVEVHISGGKAGQKLKLGLILNVLPEEKFFIDKESGVMGIWGFQSAEIGWIGTGIIFPADRFLYLDERAAEHRAVLSCERGKSIYYNIQGDWLRGHLFNRCPGEKEWEQTLKATAMKTNLN
jgi:hypothetical protein